ncbi:MAG TPA: hypothetical protein PKC28_09610 [Bdellovibrionales bacterium]|nr:hypothetical protein [Bdellovibrionales bacterium]
MKTNITEIHGPWDLGFVLDRQVESSSYLGDDEQGNPQFHTVRTEIGEAVYQLKYRSDFSKVDPLANELASLAQKTFKSIDVVVPMPPSKVRPKQPVIELAKAVAIKLSKKYSDSTLVKNSVTKQMKDLKTKDEKMAALLGSFTANQNLGSGPVDVLIVDDIFASGSSLEAACNVLRGYGAVRNIFVLVLSRTKS